MDITLQYFDGCPNWMITAERLAELVAEGIDVTVSRERIDSHEQAVECGFRGSPTVLIDGVDPFVEQCTPVGLACRVYRTETGYAGSPSLSQLRHVIVAARKE